MKAYLIDKFISSDRINVFHYCMFHGEQEAHSGVYKNNPSHNLGEDLSDLLCLSRNGRIIPDVFMPGTSFVVSNVVKEKLAGLPNAIFLDVVFKKLIDFYYKAGDFSYYDTPQFQQSPRRADPEKLIKKLPDVPSLHKQIGAYYELVVAHLDDVVSKYNDAIQVDFNIVDLGDIKQVSMNISKRILVEYAILRTYHGVLLNEIAFEKVSSFMDWDYFSKVEIKIMD
ncbi:MAG: hypothetical protein ACJ8FY_20080 [Gemmataceae bacterium]